jgi:hypothetical protein
MERVLLIGTGRPFPIISKVIITLDLPIVGTIS